MKKIWSILMAAMILCLAASVPSLAEGTPTLELRSSASSVQPGGEFTVELVIHNNPGIAGIRFAFQYDETLLQLADANGQSLTDWEVGIKAKQDETGEKVDRENAVWAQGENWTGSDCGILRLTFRVLENAPMDTVTTIGITGLDIMNASLQEVPFTATSATVTIQEEPPLSVTPSSSALSGTYTVSGQVVTVTYDKPCKVGYLSGGKYVAAPAVASGSGYAFTLPDGITEAILVVKGDVNGDGKINIADVNRLFRYTSKKEITLVLKVETTTTSVQQGENVVIKISMSSNTTKNIAAIGFNVDVPDSFEYVSHTLASGLPKNAVYTNRTGTFGCYNGQLSGDFEIVTITYKVKEAADAGEVSVGIKNDDDLSVTDVDDGLVDLTINPCTLTITTPHVHQWPTNWTSDGTHHWHECMAEGCTLTAGTANSEKGGYAEHNWTAANCTTAKACSICGKTEGSALGHDWADATCTAPKTCKRTGCTATDGSPLNHDWATDWTIGDVQHWHKCNRTGCTVINAAANHIPDRNAATEDDPVKCTECGKVLTPALGHVHTSHLTSVAAKAPTCTAPGNAAYWKCSCDKLFSDDTATTETTLAAVTKAALGHDHNGPWVTTDENEHWKVCAREGCNEQLDKAVHNPSAWVNVGDGYHHQTCTVCERELTHEVCTFGQTLKYNAASHWEECTKCGNKQNEAAHEFLPDSDKCTGCDYTKSSTITIITPTQPGDSKPAESNPSTGAVSGSVGYIAIGLAVVGALCLGAKKLTKKHED